MGQTNRKQRQRTGTKRGMRTTQAIPAAAQRKGNAQTEYPARKQQRNRTAEAESRAVRQRSNPQTRIP